MQKRAASLCPLCEAPNLCAVTKGEPIDACWCLHADFPDVNALYVANLLEPPVADACICQACMLRLTRAAMLTKDVGGAS